MPTANVSLNNAKFFDGLKKRAKLAVDDEVFLRSDKMLEALKFRRQLIGGQGRFPLGDGSKQRQRGREGESHSHTAWQRSKTAKGNYVLKNNHVNSVDGYNYVNNLIRGLGWSRRVSFGVLAGTAARLTRPVGGRVFSTQMPHGLSPWLRHNKRLLEVDIKRAIRRTT